MLDIFFCIVEAERLSQGPKWKRVKNFGVDNKHPWKSRIVVKSTNDGADHVKFILAV